MNVLFCFHIKYCEPLSSADFVSSALMRFFRIKFAYTVQISSVYHIFQLLVMFDLFTYL